jgi:glycosyltransferase involved in cell wall biosynthesis
VLYDRAVGLGVSPKRIGVIPSGDDIDNIRPGNKLDARRRLGLPAGARILGFAGFVDQDIDLVLAALARVAREVPQARALIVGERDFATRTAQKLNIEDKVIIPGVRPYQELPDYLAASDVLALPLRDTLFNRARWPNKVGDYLAAGRPTVTNPVGDVRHLFERYPIGLLAEPNDPEDFARQVTRLFNDSDVAERMGIEARRLGEQEYSWARMAEQLEDFYFLTLNHRKARSCR